MQEQTAVIQIDTSHSSNLIITEKTLGMNKTRCILINFYTTFEQRFIMGLRQKENHFLIRDSRCHDPHIHTTLCSVAQTHQHLIVNDQIRRKNIHIPLCMVDNIQINILSYCLMIQRCITIRLYKAVSLKRFFLVYLWHELFVILRGMVDVIPHFQKHHSHTPHSFAR